MSIFGVRRHTPLPEHGFAGATGWLNTQPLSSAELRGRVVLVDFWTFTCINWLRTEPWVRAWSRVYREDGLLVIGVHTPEFSFEHDLERVREQVQERAIDYPVALDNDYAIWRAFDNQYWPALYVLDQRGRVRHQHFGEGEYEQSETMIQRLLAEAGATVTDQALVRVDPGGLEAQADWGNLKSPENYLGYQRTERFASPGGVDRDRSHRYAPPARLALNQWALAGDWTVSGQAIRSTAPGARLVNRFHARDLHLVMGPPRRDSPLRFRVSIDGRPPGPAHGVDVDEGGNGTLAEQRLYQLIRQPGPIADRQFEVEFLDAGAEAFAFTFG
jgi:SAM-dependent methyltransferase